MGFSDAPMATPPINASTSDAKTIGGVALSAYGVFLMSLVIGVRDYAGSLRVKVVGKSAG